MAAVMMLTRRVAPALAALALLALTGAPPTCAAQQSPTPPPAALVLPVPQARAEAIALAHLVTLSRNCWPGCDGPHPRDIAETRLVWRVVLETPRVEEEQRGGRGRRGGAARSGPWARGRGPLGMGGPGQCVYSVLVDVADGAVVEEAGTVHRVGWPTPQSWYTHSLGRKEAERTAPRPPTRRASSGLPLVVGALLVAASLLGSLFVRARRAPFHR